MATLDMRGRRYGNTALYRAALAALVVELALFGGAFLLLRHRVIPPVPPAPLIMQLAAPTPAPTPPTPPAPKPVATPRPAPPHKPAQRRHEAHRPPPVKKVAPRPAPPAAANPPPVMPPAPTPTPMPPAPPSPPPQPQPQPAPSADPSFESAMRAAIQAALRYPESARMSGMAGRTRVAFRYRDARVFDVSVIASSGSALLDRAALAAVRNAAYPPPRPALVGKTLSEQLWVTFNLKDDNP